MTNYPRILATSLLAVTALLLWQGWAASQENFDRLSAEDRQEMAKRFDREIWPLFLRGDKNGCVGCHSGKIVSSLRMTGKSEVDFPKMLAAGFFVPNDPGSLLSRILDKDKKRVMPPPSKGPRWSEEDVQTLRAFVNDLDMRQGKRK